VSGDEARANLNGVFVQRGEDGRLRMVATDGHRLAMVTRAAEGDGFREGLILSRRSVLEMRKALEGDESEVELVLAGGVVHMRRGPVRMSMRLVDGQFPDYRQVIPEKGDRLVMVDVDALSKALRRVSVVSSERTRGVRLHIESNKMELTASSDLGDAVDEIEVDYDGESMTIGFNARYVIDALAVMPSGGRVELTLIDEVSPGVLRETGDLDYCYIVMPMRL
jgi:DNA polymerase-3 subunit beta